MNILHRRFRLFLPTLAGALLLASPTGVTAQDGVPAPSAASAPVIGSPGIMAPDATLRPGDVLVLASWRCSYMRLERVNELARAIVEVPLTRAVEAGRLRGWGQFNGGFRDEFNYHTFYIAPSIETYRQVLGSVLRYMNDAAAEEMQEFYQLCDFTQETTVTVVTSRP